MAANGFNWSLLRGLESERSQVIDQVLASYSPPGKRPSSGLTFSSVYNLN